MGLTLLSEFLHQRRGHEIFSSFPRFRRHHIVRTDGNGNGVPQKNSSVDRHIRSYTRALIEWRIHRTSRGVPCTAMVASMLRPKMVFVPAALVGLPEIILLTAQASLSEPVADQCRSTPSSSAPSGTRWQYRINRTDKRRCWYLRSNRVRMRSHQREATETARPAPSQTI